MAQDAADDTATDAPTAAPATDDNPVAPQHVYILSTTTDPALEGVTARVGAAARAALRGVQGALWEEADRRYLGYDEATLASANAARAHLAEGRQAYLNLEFESAIDLLGQSVSEFDRAAVALRKGYRLPVWASGMTGLSVYGISSPPQGLTPIVAATPQMHIARNSLTGTE